MSFAIVALISVILGQVDPSKAVGNAMAGKALFEGAGGCVTCHSLDEPSRRFGSDLSWIGVLRTPDALRKSIVDPDDQVFRRYYTVVVETKTGQRFEGLAQSEDERTIQIRDDSGQSRSFIKADLQALRREERSLMPSYALTLSASQI